MATTVAIVDGAWNDAAIWSNGIPNQNTRAIISSDATVDLNGSDHFAQSVVVHGTLNVPQQSGDPTPPNIGQQVHVNVGQARRGVGVADNAVGVGYILFSKENVQSRFGIQADAASNVIGVRREADQWQFNDNSATWRAFTPEPSDRLLAEINMTTDTVTSFRGVDDEIAGIARGYDSGNLYFLADVWGGRANDGEFLVGGNSFSVTATADHNNNIGQTRRGIGVDDSATGEGYLLFSEQSVQSRFGIQADAASNIIAVRQQADQWQYSDNSLTWRNFTPAAGDRLLAEINMTTDSVLSLEGQTGSINGIASGYVSGDLTFQADVWNGLANDGEFIVIGNWFTAGDLNTDSTDPKSLTTRWVHVNSGGVFQVGSEADRFDTNDFTLTLTGTDPTADHVVELANGNTIDIVNNDGFLIAAGGGRLQFFGQEKTSFTKLSRTAESGTSTIFVARLIERNFDGTTSELSDGLVNWEVGDEIVIASSNHDYRDEDVRTIVNVTTRGDEVELTLNSPLTHRHYGEIETYANGSESIDLRAEVALLNRNIVIKGLESQDTDNQFGDRANLEIVSDAVATLQGQTEVFQGITRGFDTGDITVTANQFGGAFSQDQFTIAGTSFRVNGVERALSVNGKGIRVQVSESGPAFLMYTAQAPQARFGGIRWDGSRNVAIVRYNMDAQTWEAHRSNSGGWRAFTPRVEDTLLAEVELDSQAGLTVNGIGGHVMVVNGAGQSTVDGVQLDQLGQAGRLGRYPFHWHFGGDRSGDVLRNVSVTNSNNRGVILHGTDNVRIEGVVLHDVHGHGFFLESGVEQGNTFVGNIALGVHRVGSTSNLSDPFIVDFHDRQNDGGRLGVPTSPYWITNADNVFVGNIAAGSNGTGFWFGPTNGPVNVPQSVADVARLNNDPYLQMMFSRDATAATTDVFSHNTAHSVGAGLVLDSISSNLPGPAFGDEVDNISNFTVYKTQDGFYTPHRSLTVNFDNFKAADNEIHFWESSINNIDGGLIVGESRGNAELSPLRISNAFFQYLQASTFADLHIAGFGESSVGNTLSFFRVGGASLIPEMIVSGWTYEDAATAQRVRTKAGGPTTPGIVRSVYDADGSLTSQVGGGAGYSWVPYQPFWFDGNDGDRVISSSANLFSAAITRKRFGALRMSSIYVDEATGTGNQRLRVTSPTGESYDFSGTGSEVVVSKPLDREPRFATVVGKEYSISYPNGLDLESRHIRFQYPNYNRAENSASNVFRFTQNSGNLMAPFNRGTGEAVPMVNSLAELRAATETAHYVASNGDLYLKMFNSIESTEHSWFEMLPLTTAATSVVLPAANVAVSNEPDSQHDANAKFTQRFVSLMPNFDQYSGVNDDADSSESVGRHAAMVDQAFESLSLASFEAGHSLTLEQYSFASLDQQRISDVDRSQSQKRLAELGDAFLENAEAIELW